MKTKVSSHFDAVAQQYDSHRTNSLLSYLVQKERKAILRVLQPLRNKRVLDVGCGAGYYSIAMKKNGALPVGIDISKAMIVQLQQKGIEGYVSDVAHFTTRKKFDTVLCAGTLEFVASPKQCLDFFYRFLKSQGEVVILFPRKNLFGLFYTLYHLLHGFRIHLFQPRKLAASLKQAGFSSVRLLSHPNVLTGIAVAKK